VAALSVLFAAAPLAAQANDGPPRADGPGLLHGQYRPGHIWMGGAFIPNPNAAPAGARLTYFGGRVISNAQVVLVVYGSGSFLPQVTSAGSPSMSSFLQQVLNSPYVDWLTEYNAPASGGTNQTIGRGSFLSRVTITPSAANNGSTISDTQIQSELVAQMSAGHLPAPAHDAAGNPNTVYMVYFPHGKVITQGGSSSCSSGGFCAYHGTIGSGPFGEFYYGVFPDMQPGSGCETGCGSGTAFGNYTSVASHELVEAITDPEVGLATALGPPLAWYDNTNGEIGDICNAQQGTIVGGDGVTYTVQKEFSNVANDCIVSRAPAASDFSLSLNPSALSVSQGSSGASTVSTAIISGSAQTISLTVTGQPSGVTTSSNPSSVTSGGSSTLTITASSTAAAGTYTLSVNGTATSGFHAATLSLTVTASGGGGGEGAIVNGTFEAGNLSGWTSTGASESVVSTGCHGGTSCAKLGTSPAPTNGDSSITQTFTAPAGATGLTFWYKETCPDTVAYDWALATLRDNTAATTSTILPKICATNAWTQVNRAVLAGHSYTLTLTSHDDNYTGDATYTLFDDVAVTTLGPPPGGLANGGFESAFDGWTTSGAATAIVTTGCHGGTSCARAGSTSPTDGDSNIVQTFTVPAGKTQLSIWRRGTCPDTVTYDWAIITLRDNTTGTTATVLPKTCATNASWVNVTASVTAGHSYTLTLTSHDDNYSADPTYTFFDDIVLN
jgi:hypothetical protein